MLVALLLAAGGLDELLAGLPALSSPEIQGAFGISYASLSLVLCILAAQPVGIFFIATLVGRGADSEGP